MREYTQVISSPKIWKKKSNVFFMHIELLKINSGGYAKMDTISHRGG